ncbi:MAG: response regulator transcription factor [Coriobacteriales bacterium]|jgi:two-component system response regulator VicR|nr:response regulator transcription factor [Coriobacteriales bacterium]
MKILLIDDEESIRRLVASLMADAGHTFLYAEDGFKALSVVEDDCPALIIMDVMMPRMDGFTACREIRKRGIAVPVIFLSAKGDIVDKGVGFEAGGDDYIVKPFDPRELLMHIEAHLRRAQMAPMGIVEQDTVLHAGHFVLDTGRFRATKDGEVLSLTVKEFRILHALAGNPGMVLSREQLVEAAWGKEFVGETSSITVFIKKLREKIEDDPSNPCIIQTVWGLGYRFEPEQDD